MLSTKHLSRQYLICYKTSYSIPTWRPSVWVASHSFNDERSTIIKTIYGKSAIYLIKLGSADNVLLLAINLVCK